MYRDFFKVIDSEEKAYWLGFIAADGNVSADYSKCTIELKRSDKEHLKKFNRNFNNYYKVADYAHNEYLSSRIMISSKQCCLDLVQYGIIPNKSLTLNVKTELIPENLIRHYIRGYFDGDGSIYCSHPNRTSGYNYDEWGCNFVGTKEMLTFFKEYLKLDVPVRQKGNIFELDVGGTLLTYEVVNYLYDEATVYLDRKKEKVEKLRSSQRLNKLVSKRDYFAEEKETSVLVGLILGGGSIRNLVIQKQSNKLEALRHVKEICEQYHYRCELVECSSSYGKTYNLRVQITPEIAAHYKHHFYPNGNKTVTRHLLNELNNDALDIWITLNSRTVDKGLAFGTTQFTEDENKIIQQYFNVVHGLDARLHKNRDKYFIYLTAKSKQELFSKVYVPRGT